MMSSYSCSANLAAQSADESNRIERPGHDNGMLLNETNRKNTKTNDSKNARLGFVASHGSMVHAYCMMHSTMLRSIQLECQWEQYNKGNKCIAIFNSNQRVNVAHAYGLIVPFYSVVLSCFSLCLSVCGCGCGDVQTRVLTTFRVVLNSQRLQQLYDYKRLGRKEREGGGGGQTDQSLILMIIVCERTIDKKGVGFVCRGTAHYCFATSFCFCYQMDFCVFIKKNQQG